MSDSGDYDAEMFRRTSLDDTTIERILAGEAIAGHEMLASFVADTELVASPFGPEPNDALTAFLVAASPPKRANCR